MTELDRFTAVWAHCAWVDAWQGALLASAVWLLCRLWPGMPARGRAWLWWLVGLKFVLGFIPISGIPLPILPSVSRHVGLMGLHFAVGNGVHVECASAACASYTSSPAFVHCIHMVGVMLRVFLIGFWTYGLIVNIVKAAHGWWHAYLLRYRSVAVMHPAISFECRRLCFFVGIRPPLLLESEELTSPVLTGFFRPAIILPSDIIMDCKVHDARMMLAHELAHLKRRDLLFGWVPAIAQLLNWWNPLLWMVSREWGLAQEIACDEFAVQTTAALPVHFGQMLLAITVAGRRPQAVGIAAVGLTGEHQTLKRRLLGMRYIGRRNRPGVNMTMRTLLFSVALFLVPWHPVPRNQFRAPVLHSRAAMIVWHDLRMACRAVDHGANRVSSICASLVATHPAAVAPAAVAATPPINLPQTNGPDDWDFSGASGREDLQLTRDPNVKPADMIDGVKDAFTPNAPGATNASVY